MSLPPRLVTAPGSGGGSITSGTSSAAASREQLAPLEAGLHHLPHRAGSPLTAANLGRIQEDSEMLLGMPLVAPSAAGQRMSITSGLLAPEANTAPAPAISVTDESGAPVVDGPTPPPPPLYQVVPAGERPQRPSITRGTGLRQLWGVPGWPARDQMEVDSETAAAEGGPHQDQQLLITN